MEKEKAAMYSTFQSTFPPPPTHSVFVLGLAMWVPVFFLGTGSGLFLWASRRKFYRTNEASVEEFDRFRSKVLARFFEGMMLLLGLLLIAMGLFRILWVVTLF